MLRRGSGRPVQPNSYMPIFIFIIWIIIIIIVIITAIKTAIWRWSASAAGGDGNTVGVDIDALRPATSRRTWRCRDAVRLDLADTGPLSHPPITVVTALRNTVQQFPDQLALGLC